MKILVIHGPNLDQLGKREPEIYGKSTLNELNQILKKEAEKNNIKLTIFQSNHEGEIVEKIHQAKGFDGLIINPAAFTHYSIAIRDALDILKIKKIEVHLSNIYAREPFREKSVISAVCNGQISGFGIKSYQLALHYFKNE